MAEPIWGTPPPPLAGRDAVQDPRPPAPPIQPIQWQAPPPGLARAPMPSAAIGRQAVVALVVNLLVLFMAVGLMSAPGAAMALRARSLAWTDPVRAQRSLMWSWLLLASNLLLYLLLVVVIVLIVISVLTG